MNWIIPLDAIALLSILVASFFLWNSRFAKHYKEARFALFLLLILYFFQGTSSILERSGITSSLKVVKAYLGLMLPMVLFFAVYALLKEQSEIKLNMYRSLVSLNEDIIYFIDSNYLYCSVNEAFLSAHGKKHDEVIGCSVAEIVGKNTFESKLKAHFDLCLSGEMIKFQEVFNYSSLGLREMDVIFHPVRGKSDLITGVVVSCRDIAEHNLRELTLKDKEERFHTLFDGMTDGIAVCKAVEKGTDFVFKDINRAAQEMDGVLRDEVIGRKLTEVFPGVKKSGVLDVMCRVWKTGNTGNCIETHYNGDDIAFWRKNTVYKLPSGEVVAVYSDETLIRHSVEALRRSEKRYRTLVETMVHGVHEIDISGITVFANSAYHRILGYENGELIGRSMFFNQDPDVSNSLMEYIESRIQQKSKPKPWFGKACKKDGTLIDIQADWNYRLSDRSEITGFISIVTDISQRVKNERALKTEHSRFVAIMDSLEALVFVSDMDTHEILFANKKIRKQSGEVTGGVCWQNLRRGQTAPCSLCAIPLLLDANGKPEEPHIWEFMNPVENRWYQSSDQAISWPDGRIVHLGIATDITQRKLAEDALLVESQRLTNIIDGANAGTWQWNVQTGELTINDRW
ncbi:MAG: PAS domain S-box protein, partial [Candidatus Sabulitectum sp.]|nr:PAS domain S-box protein [Candidatus Sabulitectum sp.]